MTDDQKQKPPKGIAIQILPSYDEEVIPLRLQPTITALEMKARMDKAFLNLRGLAR